MNRQRPFTPAELNSSEVSGVLNWAHKPGLAASQVPDASHSLTSYRTASPEYERTGSHNIRVSVGDAAMTDTFLGGSGAGEERKQRTLKA